MIKLAGGSPSRRVAILGLLLALALALSFMETMLPALPMGVKPGLSNIVTMYCLFFLTIGDCLSVAALKSVFVALMRGPVAGSLSFAGGMLSVAVMLLLIKALPGLSKVMVSVAGAVTHNLGQLFVAWLLLGSAYTWYYLPVMVLSGVVMGLLTGTLLRFAIPYLSRMGS